MFATSSAGPWRPPHRRPGRRRHRAAGHRRPQRRDPRDRHQDVVALRRAAQDHRRRRGDRADHRALPDLDARELRERLSTKRGFVWLKREITPEQQREVHRLGIPGIGFLTENKRFYPSGPTVAHVLGLVNIDNQGIAGIEK